MCAFHYWLALITKPFQPGGNNGFRRQLNCPARFATDSLIGMQRFTCAFSPTIGCHTPPPSPSRKSSPSRSWYVVNDWTLKSVKKSPRKEREILEMKGSDTWKRLVGSPCEICFVEREIFGKFSARLASLMIDHIKGLAVTRLGYNLYR